MSQSEPEPAESAVFRVRAAEEHDLEQMLDLYRLLDGHQREWRVIVPTRDPVADAEVRFREAMADPDARAVVAEAGGRVIGIGMGRIGAVSSLSDEPGLELTSVVVSPEHRGRGIGRAIARDLAAFARSRDVGILSLRVFSPNQEAQDFWSAIGFAPRLVHMVARSDRV